MLKVIYNELRGKTYHVKCSKCPREQLGQEGWACPFCRGKFKRVSR